MKKRFKEFWFKLPDKIRFLLIGGFNTAFSYSIFSIICFIIGESFYQISLASAWIISSIVSYTTQRCFVFNVKGSIIKQYLKCCTTWFFSYIINATLLEIFVKKIYLNVYFAQIIATLSCAVFTYILLKSFAFKKKPNQNLEKQTQESYIH